MSLRIETLSVFPDLFEPAMSTSIMGRARDAGLFEFVAHDLRDWTHDRHRTVDDAPYGGGQGMLMMCTPFFEALDELCPPADPAYIICFTPTGEPFTQAIAEDLAQRQRLMFVCGHYEGMDERVFKRADRCLSLGDFVMTGGELAALVVCDAVIRLLPGALGDEMSAHDESFTDGLLEYEQYTRPAVVDGMGVPEVLLSGDHERVARWRRANSIVRTCVRRPDLIEAADLTEDERMRAERLITRLASGTSLSEAVGEIFPELGS